MKKTYYNYVALNIFSYAAIGMFFPLVGQYLDSLGFDGTQIGITTALGTTVAIFATTFWGERYNNSHKKKKVVIFLCLVSAIWAMVLLGIEAYILFLIGFMILFFFYSPIMGLNDAMTIESGQSFNAIRKWGSIGFAVSTFVAGRCAEAFGLWFIFLGFSLSFVLSAVVIWIMICREGKPEIDYGIKNESEEDIIFKVSPDLGTPHIKEERTKYIHLIKNKKYLAIIISAFFVMGTNVANNTYFSFLYIEGGGNLGGVGTAFLLMAGSEAIFMALSSRISRKISLEKTILIAMIISVLRFGWYSSGPSSVLLLGTFFLQGMVNGIILVEFIRYINKTVEKKELGMGISLYYALSTNFSTIFCQFLGGLALDYGGGSMVYLFFSIYNFIGVIIYLIFGLHRGSNKM
jgi:PPP family 3-phenylpropionic acid transporter